MKRHIAIKLLSALTVGGAVFAMAATLGVTSDGVGAGNASVASCDTDGVSVSYSTSWDATDKRYEITNVTLSGVADPCNTRSVKVTLTDSTGASLSESTDTVVVNSALTDTSHTVTVTNGVSAASVTGVHVAIA